MEPSSCEVVAAVNETSRGGVNDVLSATIGDGAAAYGSYTFQGLLRLLRLVVVVVFIIIFLLLLLLLSSLARLATAVSRGCCCISKHCVYSQ